MPNILLTPHICSSTEEAQVNIGRDVSSKLVAFADTGVTTGSLPVRVLSLPVQENTHRILLIHKKYAGSIFCRQFRAVAA